MSSSLLDNFIGFKKGPHIEHVRFRKAFEAREPGLDVFTKPINDLATPFFNFLTVLQFLCLATNGQSLETKTDQMPCQTAVSLSSSLSFHFGQLSGMRSLAEHFNALVKVTIFSKAMFLSPLSTEPI